MRYQVVQLVISLDDNNDITCLMLTDKRQQLHRDSLFLALLCLFLSFIVVDVIV